MSKLQKKAGKAWNWVEHGSGCCKIMGCSDCFYGPDCEYEDVERWLHTNGFPARRPHIHTAAELAKQLIMGSSLSCLTQRIAQVVEAVTCPDCGKHTMHRERRMVCTGCNSVYPPDRWAKGEPCECGGMDARYYGIHSANRLGQLEFRRCQTPGCRWAGDYRPLTVPELADLAQEEAYGQRSAARTCPDCGDASGNDQIDGVYLPIERCGCGLQTPEPEGEEK